MCIFIIIRIHCILIFFLWFVYSFWYPINVFKFLNVKMLRSWYLCIWWESLDHPLLLSFYRHFPVLLMYRVNIIYVNKICAHIICKFVHTEDVSWTIKMGWGWWWRWWGLIGGEWSCNLPHLFNLRIVYKNRRFLYKSTFSYW